MLSENIQEIINSLLNRTVQFVRLAGNSLIIYIDCEPGVIGQGYSIWMEPTWHLRNNVEVITGSRAAQTEDEAEHKIISGFFKQIHMKSIKKITIEPITNDLQIELEEGIILKTFVSDPSDEESWHIKDLYKRKRIIGSPRTLQVIKEVT
ncbi:hypothetical protein M6D81_30565 [Paenibacillus sp. J5C_2022]|uniref:hypothetical protein n=1 Tax=Paenibacillus sp. J5C2022 TaxID=2977129 RepID=UPI0021D2BB84|nr:hypothetical protein [Paenibacillus sp. J5C2022]MCU6713051.1 hypothetical protein [Paenibacillus sp. J5C2022]